MISQEGDKLSAATFRLQMELDAALVANEGKEDGRRKQLASALQSIVTFMEDVGIRPAHCHAIADLVDGFVELDRGNVRPFFRPQEGNSNRHADGADVWRARANVSGAFYALVKAGQSRHQASAMIAKFKHLERLPGKQAKSLRNAAKSWFDDFRAGKVPERSAADVFSTIVRAADQLAAEHPDRLEAFAVEMLADKSGFFSFSKPST